MTEARRYRVAASMVVSDAHGRVLLVREADPRVHGKANLPGGHVEDGESVLQCARRELREETGLDVAPAGLLGVYVQADGVNFVFHASTDVTATEPGCDILRCEWLTPEEALRLPDAEVLRATRLHAVIADLLSGRSYPTDTVRNLALEEWEKG